MTRQRLLSLLALTALLSFTFALAANANTPAKVKEYHEFHEVLHPLEHEALPKRDYEQIRSQASELVKRGYAIVKLGVPEGAKMENTEAFRKELDSFQTALKTFATAADKGSDDDLKNSFSAVHDSFETLAGYLRSK